MIASNERCLQLWIAKSRANGVTISISSFSCDTIDWAASLFWVTISTFLSCLLESCRMAFFLLTSHGNTWWKRAAPSHRSSSSHEVFPTTTTINKWSSEYRPNRLWELHFAAEEKNLCWHHVGILLPSYRDSILIWRNAGCVISVWQPWAHGKVQESLSFWCDTGIVWGIAS